MERRKEDPVIVAIHVRLDRLEDISADLSEIKEWIGTVVKVTRMLELTGNFLTRWAVLWLKLTGAIGFVWITFKYGLVETGIWVRGWFGR